MGGIESGGVELKTEVCIIFKQRLKEMVMEHNKFCIDKGVLSNISSMLDNGMHLNKISNYKQNFNLPIHSMSNVLH